MELKPTRKRIDPLVFVVARFRKQVTQVLGQYRWITLNPREAGTKLIREPSSHALLVAIKHLSLIVGVLVALNSVAAYLGLLTHAATSAFAVWTNILASMVPSALCLWALTRADGGSLSKAGLIYLYTAIIGYGILIPAMILLFCATYLTDSVADPLLAPISLLIALPLTFIVPPRLLQGAVGPLEGSYTAIILLSNFAGFLFFAFAWIFFPHPWLS